MIRLRCFNFFVCVVILTERHGLQECALVQLLVILFIFWSLDRQPSLKIKNKIAITCILVCTCFQKYCHWWLDFIKYGKSAVAGGQARARRRRQARCCVLRPCSRTSRRNCVYLYILQTYRELRYDIVRYYYNALFLSMYLYYNGRYKREYAYIAIFKFEILKNVAMYVS